MRLYDSTGRLAEAARVALTWKGSAFENRQTVRAQAALAAAFTRIERAHELLFRAERVGRFQPDGVAPVALLAKGGFKPDEPRVPAGNPDGGEWTGDGTAEDESVQVAAAGDLKCQGGYCQSGGTYGTTAMYSVLGRNVCRDCAVKMLGLENEPAAVKTEQLERRLIER